MTRYSVTTLLIALFAALVIPIAVFFAILIAQLQANEKISLERRTLSDAIAVSRSVEPVLREMSVALNLVTSSEEMLQGDLYALYKRTKRELEGSGNYIVAIGDGGEQLVNTRVPFETELGKINDMPGLRTILETGEEYVSNVFLDGVSREWIFNMMKPLADNNGDIIAAQITRNAIDLRRIFDFLILPPQWQAVIIDGRGRVVTAKENLNTFVGDRIELPGNVTPENFSKRDGFINAHIVARSDQMIGYALVPGTDWRSIVFGPIVSAQRSILITWYWLLIGGGIFLVFATTILSFFSRSVILSMRQLSRMARQVGKGKIVSPIDTRISELDVVAKTLSEASFDRSQKEDTIRIVMQELSHRTKNLIAVVISMVRQTARRTTSTDVMMETVTERIMGLGRSIDLLTAKDWGPVLLSDLIEKQFSNFGIIGKSVNMNGPEIFLKPEAVQHLGMALHELVTNAVKYGALSTSGGKVFVEWEVSGVADDERLTLRWTESGGPAPNKPEHKGFGSQILERHVASAFVGKTELHYGADGFRWQLAGPLSNFCGKPVETEHQTE